MRAAYLLTMLLAAPAVFPFGSAGAAPTATTFGPKQYIRATGSTQTFTETFPRCAGSPCQLVVVNGDADGSNRVSSASIYLNGRRILGPSDFNQGVDRIVTPVSLESNDQIKVVLNSAPGSYLTLSVECASFAAINIGGPPGVVSSIWDNGTVSLSIPLRNGGNASATDVSITGMSAGGGSYTGPTPFSYSAGAIDPAEIKHLSALFSGVDGHTTFPLTVNGTYGFDGAVCPFQAQALVSPPPASNGGSPKSTTTVQSFTADTAYYPPGPSFSPAENEPNAEFDYMPPLGEPRYLFPVPPPERMLNRSLAFSPSDQPPAGGNSRDVVFVRNQNAGTYFGMPPDPSAAGATPGGFVMISANTSQLDTGAVSYSTDFGKTFTTVNLTKNNKFADPRNPSRPDFFPASDGGLCCDQVLHYVPSRNLMIWVLQYDSPPLNVGGLPQKGQNRLRIAWATPEAAAADFLHAWTWFDVSPTTLGDTGATDWMDYPDVAYSNDWLYISVGHGVWNPDKDDNGNVYGQQTYTDLRWFIRASLNDMENFAPNINLVYYEAVKNGVKNAHFAQSAPDTMYYAAQPDTSTLSVFADPDSSPDIPTPKDIKVTSYCKSAATDACDYAVTDVPDKRDWNQAPHNVLGATYVDPGAFCPPEGCSGPTHFLYFAFDGGRDNDNSRPYPYVRVEKIDADALNLVSELDIWNPNFAFATPGLNWRPGSREDEVAVSLAVGGGNDYADNAVGFLGDFVVYMTTNSNATETFVGSPKVRYGDYFDVRNAFGPPIPDAGQGVGYSTLGYAVTRDVSGNTCFVSQCNVTLQYVLFGRKGDLFPSVVPEPK